MRGEPHTTLSECFKNCLCTGGAFQGSHDVTDIIFSPKKSAFVDENNHQIVTKFASLLLNNQAKALRYDDHICIFISVMLYYLL